MDLFQAMIDSSGISDASKLAYLKKYVSGEAEVLIRNFTTTNSNYTEAWNTLKNRFDNKREIVYANVRRLFNVSPVKQSNAMQTQALLDQTNEAVRALKVLGEHTDKWDTLLVFMTVEKLDSETKKLWAQQLKSTDLPKYSELCEFLEQHIRGLHAVQIPLKQHSHHDKKANSHFVHSNSNGDGSSSSYSKQPNSFISCSVCKGTHHIHKCQDFIKMQIKDRKELVSKLKLCFNCLRPSSKTHYAEICRGAGCRSCNGKHNTLLHSQRSPSNPTEKDGDKVKISNTASLHVGDDKSEIDILLATAIVGVPDSSRKMHDARIMLDSGSQATLVSEDFVRRMRLKRTYDRTRVTGIGGKDAGYTQGKVTLTLVSSVYNESKEIEALILPTVTDDMPNFPCKSDYDYLRGVSLADPEYYKPGPIDILVGAEYTGETQREGKLTCTDSTGPVAINTIFGWVLSGRVIVKHAGTVRVHVNVCETDRILQQYFEMESVPAPKHLTAEERECEQHFVQNTTRELDGRFCVKLPFNEKVHCLGSSREIAVKRWKSVERRLSNNPEYSKEYVKFMQEYIDLGHMIKIPGGEVSSAAGKDVSSYYLPHHFIVKPDSSTTKFRVVFDGSAKTTTGVSINDCLMTGAKLQDDIFPILLRFRQHRIAIKADIAKMFRQFHVADEDCAFQRIVWRAKPTDPLQDYKLVTVTYGTASAPFLSTRCLIELAESSKAGYPVSALILALDTYVDDLMSGCETVEEAIKLYRELNIIAQSARLEFRKWSCSNMQVLDEIPAELRESKEPLSLDKESNVKALGIQWNAMSDNFSFHRPALEPVSVPLTKRLVLSQLARVYDPVGLLAPVTINAKLFMQQLWKSELGWDNLLTLDLSARWHSYLDQLIDIENIQIPRYVKHPDSIETTLHGFSDASEKAYGAVIYVRNKLPNGTYSVKMLCSKSRVAPLKTVSLPRLELCGSLLLSELIESVKISLNVQWETYAWTDLMIVLQWLASHPGRWQTFVANRTSKIQELIPYDQWNHVKSEDNPADLVSRGVPAIRLQTSTLWWNGPEWLTTSNIPPKPVIGKQHVDSKLMEEKKKPIFISHVRVADDIMERYSFLPRLKRAIAYLIRFKQFIINKRQLTTHNPLSPAELDIAMNTLVRTVQQQSFPCEYDILTKRAACQSDDRDILFPLSQKSKLLSLNPVMINNVICVGGRIHKSKLLDQGRHPIILPHNSQLTKLLIWQSHHRHAHAGCKQVWCNLRENYWILNARNTIRNQLRKCVLCRRRRAKTMTQIMSELPACRVDPEETFMETGVDYAGPFNIRVMKGRSNKIFKGYMCLFVCMATKAVHIEAAGDLSTETFLQAFTRFTSRRGIPRVMYSDCGTNFVGADKELKQLLTSATHNQAVADDLSSQGIDWQFNSPSSPHHGGIWEAAVKSAKIHIKHIIGTRTLTFEEFSTVLSQVEAILNSRPIGAVTADPDDLNVLTPGHFLIRRPLTSLPAPDLTEVKLNRLSRWQICQQIQQYFWKRWHAEYLSTLQQRWKWKTKNRDIKIGDLCVLTEDNIIPSKWKLCRVIETHPGQDGCIRTVTVKTINGSLKRPITKLAPILYVEEQN